MFLCQGLLFLLELILQLLDRVLRNSEFTAKFDHLIISLIHLLRVQITVRSDNFVQILLLLQLVFILEVLLLELANQVLLQLEFLYNLLQIGVGFVRFLGLFVHLSLQFADVLKEHLDGPPL